MSHDNDITFGAYSKIEDVHKLFDVVCTFVLDSGGDGAGEIISLNYEKYAALFQEWDDERGRHFCRERLETVGESITFSDNQESITFAKKRYDQRYGEAKPWMDEIVVEIP